MLLEATFKWLQQLTCPAGSLRPGGSYNGKAMPRMASPTHLRYACIERWKEGSVLTVSSLLNASAARVLFVRLSFVCCSNHTFIPQVSLKSNLSEFGSFRVRLKTWSFIQAFWPLLQTFVTPTSGCLFCLTILSSFLPGTPVLLLKLQLCLSLSLTGVTWLLQEHNLLSFPPCCLSQIELKPCLSNSKLLVTCHPEFTGSLGLAFVLLVASISLSEGGVAIKSFTLFTLVSDSRSL